MASSWFLCLTLLTTPHLQALAIPNFSASQLRLVSDTVIEERLTKRQLLVKPLVETFFAWVKDNESKVPKNSETGKGFTYCLNQENYLKVFLENPAVPLDNNAAETAIRSFCVGKNNWHVIDTVHGAESSAIAYSLAESAKANNLKPYNYFMHLLEEIPKHMDDTNLDFLEDLLPWSPALPEDCKKKL